ncbi:MAG: glycosyltransferase family 2 protein [Solirubrobacteraceae bacterium]
MVVASWRRPEALVRCLTALTKQTGAEDEIVAVVRADDAPTLAALQKLRERADRPGIRLVHPSRPGLVAALDAGFQASVGAIVCFTDDDAVPRSEWLPRIRRRFEQEPGIGAVGGRDWNHVDGHTDAGSAARVGELSWFGRIVGNHHLGMGDPRDVQILKGANMSSRREALREVGFDPSLRGTGSQAHNEVGLCLQLRRRGWRIVYDPEVAVDHYLAPRPGDARAAFAERADRDVADAAHNLLYGLLVGLRGPRRAVAIAFQLLVGSREDPGPVLCLERIVRGREGRAALRRARAALGGRLAALGSYLKRGRA